MPTHLRRIIVGVAVVILAGVVAVDAARRMAQWPEHLSALSTNMGNIGRVSPGIVDIFVVRWSTAAEKDRLVAAFAAHGADELLEELMDVPHVGYLRTPDDRAYNIYFAWDEPASDGGRRIVLATARPLKFWEAATPRWNTYGFTLIEIHLNRDGKGEGKMSLTTKVTLSEGLDLIELEDYANEPARLIFTP
jgi:hypothetical protein